MAQKPPRDGQDSLIPESSGKDRWGRGKYRLLVVLLIGSCVAVVSYVRLAHGLTVVFTHFAYLPIVLAAFLWGRGSVWVALLIGMVVLGLRLLMSTSEPISADILRVVFFVVVAFCVGTLSESEKGARRLEEQSRRQLEHAHRRLLAAERLASVGQLSAGVAHELNNPLATILMYSHMLLKQLPDDDSRRADLEMVVREATRCRGIVRGLLDFARESRISKALCDLATLIDDVAVTMSPAAERAGVEIGVEVNGGLPMMMIDANQIKQMLVNLVQNGIDAAAQGGHVGIRAERGKDEGSVTITVEDDGCGVPEENMSKLLTPFFTTKEVGKGTGLGLAIAYGVAKMHSGEISVESRPGEGSVFVVSLPVGQEGEDRAAGKSAALHGDSVV